MWPWQSDVSSHLPASPLTLQPPQSVTQHSMLLGPGQYPEELRTRNAPPTDILIPATTMPPHFVVLVLMQVPEPPNHEVNCWQKGSKLRTVGRARLAEGRRNAQRKDQEGAHRGAAGEMIARADNFPALKIALHRTHVPSQTGIHHAHLLITCLPCLAVVAYVNNAEHQASVRPRCLLPCHDLPQRCFIRRWRINPS